MKIIIWINFHHLSVNCLKYSFTCIIPQSLKLSPFLILSQMKVSTIVCIFSLQNFTFRQQSFIKTFVTKAQWKLFFDNQTWNLQILPSFHRHRSFRLPIRLYFHRDESQIRNEIETVNFNSSSIDEIVERRKNTFGRFDFEF